MTRKRNVGTIEIKKEPKKARPEVQAKVARMFHLKKEEPAVIKELNMNGELKKKKIFFLDVTAMVHYAGPLYGKFLVREEFSSEKIVPGEGNIFITNTQALNELKMLEDSRKNRIYKGYKSFMEKNLVVLSAEDSIDALRGVNCLKELTGNEEVAENESYAHVIGSLYLLYNANLKPVLITADDKTEEVAERCGFEIKKIS